jgi:hypothetical protein
MFAHTSRYWQLPTATYVGPDGRALPYVLLRLFPVPSPTGQSYGMRDGNRLDLLAYRLFRDAEQFWRLCDANRGLRPEDLEAAGQTLIVPLPIA